MTPAWERVTAIASVLLVLGGLVVGLRLTWRRHRTNAVIVALAVAGGLYPVTQAFRLTAAGSETADRATAFVFVGIGCVVALALVELRRTHPTWRRHALLTAALAIGFVGQVVVGAGPAWAQLPGPYLVSADSRSIDAEGIDAARWALAYLGPGNRVGTDRVNRLLMATYGRQYTVTTLSDPIGIADVFSAPTLGPEQVKILRELRVRYLIVDMRLSTGLPRIGVYFEADEPGVPHMTPISPGALAKFDHDPRISRVFDSGDIVIYDLGGLINGS